MKRIAYVAMSFLTIASIAWAQSGSSPSTDVLGAHNNYGRGCTACHAAHSGTSGNGTARGMTSAAGNAMLWGDDLSELYGKTITTGGGKFVEVLPSSTSANTPDVTGMLTCLGCHDGNYAQSTMMRNRVYESLPSTYGSRNAIPTVLGIGSGDGTNYLNEHPMGLSAAIACGSGGWDCTQSKGTISMTGTNSARFVQSYGFFVKPGAYGNSAVVVCTTCHDPHVMNVVKVTSGSASGLPPGNYTTMFFLRGPYNPNDSNPQSNQTAQFCRQCHGALSNEMNGSTAGTIF